MKETESLTAAELIDHVLAEKPGKPCFTCSFQAEDMVVLHLLRKRVPEIPVVFLDTGYHFKEIYAYRDRIARAWKLNLINIEADQSVAGQEREFGQLYRSAPAQCCELRKVKPLMRTLDQYEIWFTGLRREQSKTRWNLQILETQQLPSGKSLLKVNPLAAWDWERVSSYMTAQDIEILPLYDLGYRSIGCEPCTSIPEKGADPRSGRWRGTQSECGIHTFSEGEKRRKR